MSTDLRDIHVEMQRCYSDSTTWRSRGDHVDVFVGVTLIIIMIIIIILMILIMILIIIIITIASICKQQSIE